MLMALMMMMVLITMIMIMMIMNMIVTDDSSGGHVDSNDNDHGDIESKY